MYRKFARRLQWLFFFSRVQNDIGNFENRLKYRQNEIYLRKRNNTERFRRYSLLLDGNPKRVARDMWRRI